MISWKDCKFEDIHDDGFTHCFEEQSVAAIRAALGARRPLLVRGEPGVGKSQLAKAAAWALRRPLVSHVVTGRSEVRDLHYRFDAVARLAQAQILAVASKDAPAGLELLDEQRYVQPGPLWWVFNWKSADEQHEKKTRVKGVRPEDPPSDWKWNKETGSVVLLLDEIDKADPDVPNGLLESLGNRQFAVPYFKDPIRCNPAAEPPLVIITTNEERELPAAFVRRCLVLHLALPEGDELKGFLIARGRAHFGKRFSDKVLAEAAKQLADERGHDNGDALVRPGQAEYLDLLAALLEVAAPNAADQLRQLKEIKGFALSKNSPET